MRRNLAHLLFCVCAVLCAVRFSGAQQVATGLYRYGSFDNRGFDAVNVGNLNVHFEVPIFSKIGRGLPFNFGLRYDSSFWSQTNHTWQPSLGYGWLVNDGLVAGYVSYNRVNIACDLPLPQHGSYYLFDGFTYHDSLGISHSYNDTLEYDPQNCDQTISNFSDTTNDGSAFTLTATVHGTSASTVVTTRAGQTFNVPSHTGGYAPGASSIVDANGNKISATSTGIFTDTLGTTVMTVAGSGTAASPMTYTYPTTTGTAQYTVKYVTKTVQTNFGCSGVTEYPATSTPLVSEIDLPDTSKYTFNYEQTPGYPASVTGRLSSVTLPTGGTIDYSYSGGSNGIVCADGSTAGLTRSLPNDPAGATTTYTRTVGTGTSHTAVSNSGVNSAYDFISPTNEQLVAELFQTNSVVYVTGSTTNVLASNQTCYNGAATPCTTTSVSLPITSINTYGSHDGTGLSGTTALMNSNGLQTEQDQYDYGTTSARGILLSKQTWTYPSSGNTWAVSETDSYDGSSHLLSRTGYKYDEQAATPTSGLPQHTVITSTPGNTTSVYYYTSPSGSYAKATFKYDDAGQVLNATDVNGNPTTYTYDTSTDALLQQIARGSTLQQTATWDANSGRMLTYKDFNHNQTTYAYDNMLRLTSTGFSDNGVKSTTYSIYTSSSSPATVTAGVLHRTGGTTINSKQTLDGYGRVTNLRLTDTAGDDLVDYTYDSLGNLYTESNPYRLSTDPTYGVTYFSYDALGRGTGIQAPDGSPTTAQYLANATLSTDAAGRKREVFADGMGRITEVLEPDASNNLSLATNYSYWQNFNSTSGTTQMIVQQKGGSTNSSLWRTRTFTSDQLGRMITANVPESGSTTYTYSIPGSYCAGDLTVPCTRTDARGVVVTYAYDTHNRPLGMTYSGITPATAAVTYSYDQTSYNGLTIVNGLGQRTGMVDGSGSTAWSFDTMGRVAATRRTLNGVTHGAAYTYNQDGTLNTLQDFAGTILTYGYTSTGLQQSVADSASNTYASAATYNAAGQLTGMTHQLTASSASLQRALGYNTLLQLNSIKATSNGTPIQNLSLNYGSVDQNNGNISGIVNGMDTSHGRDQTYQYDYLNRVSQGYDASHWGEQYAYDNWGNLIGNTLTKGSGYSFTVTANGANQLSNQTYDLAGEVTVDQVGNHLTYDAEGRIATAGSGGSYKYDGDGNRVMKTSGGATTLYWPSSVAGVVDESNAAATMFGRQIFLAGLRVWSEDSAGSGRFLFQDHLGSTRVTATAGGAVKDDLDYRSFGAVVANYGPSPSDNHYVFTGYESDSADSSSDYAQFRNLNYTMGRFNRPDPYYGSYDFMNPQSFNRYAYVMNRPMIFIDPSGLLCDWGRSDDGTEDIDDTDDSGCIAGGGSIYTVDQGVTVTSGDTGTYYIDVELATTTQYLEYGTFGSAPNNASSTCPGCRVPNQTPQQCATDIANHWSIAGLLPGAPGTGDSFGGGFVAGLLGNNVTGVTSLYNTVFHGDNPIPVAGTIAAAGPALGTVTSSAPVGAQGPVSATLGQIAPKAVGEFLDAAFLPKWILDSAIYGEALSYCKTGKY